MGSLITTSASNNALGYIDLDVTSFVNSQYRATRPLPWCSTTSSGGWTNFNARESASNKPSSSSRPVAAGAARSRSSLGRHGQPGRHGRHRGGSAGQPYSTYYLKFSLSSVTGSTVSSAKLRVYRNDTGAGSITLNCLQGANDSWSEGGTLPGTGSTITSVTNNAVGYVEFTVTSFVQSQYTGDKTVTFAVTTSSGSWTRFSSPRSSTNKPQLVVTTN